MNNNFRFRLYPTKEQETLIDKIFGNNVKSYKLGTGVKILDDKRIFVPRLGNVRCKFHRQVEGEIKSVTISKNGEHYYVCFLCEVAETNKLPINSNKIGLDLGIHSFAIDSNNVVYDNPKDLDKSFERLRIEQQKLCRMTEGSSNFNKQKLKIEKIQEKIFNQIRDHAHQLSSILVKQNQVICVEDLDIQGMVLNSKSNDISCSYYDIVWSQFLKILENKCAKFGRDFVKINRYVPNTKMCNNCKNVNLPVKNPDMGQWVCPVCGAVYDKSYNAAKNILEEGLKELAKRSSENNL